MKLVNPYDFFIGFELEFHNKKLTVAEADDIVSNATRQGCNVIRDGNAGELRLSGYTSRVESVIEEFRTAKAALQRHANELSVREGYVMDPFDIEDKIRAESARGIHFHISHRKYHFNCVKHLVGGYRDEVASRLYNRANVWRRRQDYTHPRVGSKYSTINVIDSKHIEFRCFNATFNTRGFCHALNEALTAAAELVILT